ncbi:phosphatidylinositol N-acetylglucosaminyltransferase-domain-containing protein [Podospora didyma]|uniref:Phosphatidylinositol N-acetylglucosaminyltransferase-domain-containing protein n=1 Tax=Podospora didyma TaxID=330526 RepID=A0AAE0U830_9PEZI|nr:phosphatidylinositol N-acetylglucosaminyltransferase-domain-containing protein [Podospora didyma]
MAPPSGLHQSAIPSDFETSVPQPQPGLVRSSTAPVNGALRSHRSDPYHLAPEDAFVLPYSPRRLGGFESGGNGSGHESRPRRMGRKDDTSRSRSRRQKRFQKLLWVKQSYPDNYTDQATFLENLQRNPRVQPYDFWPLVADSTVIVQHVCSVIIFVVCFVGIFQERVSPVSIVGWGSFATFLGWLLWDWWVTQEEDQGDAADGIARKGSMRAFREFGPPRRQSSGLGHPTLGTSNVSISSMSNFPSAASSSSNLVQDQHLQRPVIFGHYNGVSSTSLLNPDHAFSRSASSLHSATSQASAAAPARSSAGEEIPGTSRYRTTSPTRGGRVRLSTIKSAILIYSTLLGLSPILKSLTRSTSSDSIWAMSFWLLAINIFFFDYSGSWVGVHKIPVASLSTNAALMASTVLASRLPSTGQVFSLTLFSIEVFGLFPVFRRYARHRSWRYHVALTVLLVLGAGGGVGMIMGDERSWPWKNGLLGMLVGCLISALAMGGCSWWLIGLQKYKNEIYGPWDPARPIIISRRHWDDDQ